jgi:hypothetical protein
MMPLATIVNDLCNFRADASFSRRCRFPAPMPVSRADAGFPRRCRSLTGIIDQKNNLSSAE